MKKLHNMISYIIMPGVVLVYGTLIYFMTNFISSADKLTVYNIFMYVAWFIIITVSSVKFLHSNYMLLKTIWQSNQMEIDYKLIDKIYEYTVTNYTYNSDTQILYVSRYIFELLSDNGMLNQTFKLRLNVVIVIDPYRKKYSYATYPANSVIRTFDDLI